MNEAQEYLLTVGLDDKCIGTIKKTEAGEVVVDGGLVYLSDLMMYWRHRCDLSKDKEEV